MLSLFPLFLDCDKIVLMSRKFLKRSTRPNPLVSKTR